MPNGHKSLPVTSRKHTQTAETQARSARQVCAYWPHHGNTTLIKPSPQKGVLKQILTTHLQINHPAEHRDCTSSSTELPRHPRVLLTPCCTRGPHSLAKRPGTREIPLVLTAPLSSGAVSCPAACRHGPSPSIPGWRAACSRRRAGAGVRMRRARAGFPSRKDAPGICQPPCRGRRAPLPPGKQGQEQQEVQIAAFFLSHARCQAPAAPAQLREPQPSRLHTAGSHTAKHNAETAP